MKRSYMFRLHEWAADRYSWIQYPNVRPLNHGSRMPPPIRAEAFKRGVGVAGRVAVAIPVIFVGFPLLVLLIAIFWAFVSAR